MLSMVRSGTYHTCTGDVGHGSEDNELMLDRIYSGNNCGDQWKKTFGEFDRGEIYRTLIFNDYKLI